MLRKLLIGGFAGLVFSCGDSTAAPDVAAFRQLNDQLVSAVDTHQANATAMADMAGCRAERDRYHTEVLPIVDRMGEMSGGMDDCMMAMVQKTCRGMKDELDMHVGTSCASGEGAQERTEAERHANSLRQMAHQEMARADNMTQGGGMSGMMSDGTCRE